jgi:endoribonuclease Dicer
VNDLATSARQRAVLDAFREGTLNCLVATDVLEEGIDVPECQLVVLFDLRRNIKSLIQSCGRARHAQSEVVVLSPPGGDNEQLVRQVVVAEGDMRLLAQRNAREVARAIEADGDDEEEEEDPADKFEMAGGRVGIGRDDCYKVEKTGAVVTRESAIPLLHQYCAKIPHDAYSTAWAPIFEVSRTLGPTFWCTIRLPGHPWFGQTAVLGGRKVNTQVLGVGRTKRGSMAAAARQAVELLHWHGDLSDHLVPLFEKPATKERRADGTVIYQVRRHPPALTRSRKATEGGHQLHTTVSLIPTVNGDTVRSFITHGQQSAAKSRSNPCLTL